MMNYCSTLLFIVCTLFALSEGRGRGFSASAQFLRRLRRSAFGNTLYPANEYPFVKFLEASNFRETIFQDDTAFLVQFYFDWCGHCRDFKSHFSKFAEDVWTWNGTVQVGAINCAKDSNKPTCDDNGVASVPHVKYYGRHSKGAGDSRTLSAIRNADRLRHQLGESVIQEYARERYTDWPNFDRLPAVKTNLDSLWDGLPASTQHIILIFEKDPESMTGVELLLDLHSEKSLHVRRASSTHTIAKNLQMTQFPNFVVFKRNDKADNPSHKSKINLPSHLQNGGEDFGVGRMMLREVLDHLKLGTEKKQPLESVKNISTVQSLKPINDPDSYFASETDVLLALWYAIYNEIPAKGDIGGSNLTAAINFMDNVRKYLRPSADAKRVLDFYSLSGAKKETPRLDNMQAIVSDMVDQLQESKVTKISPEQWKQLFKDLEAKHQNPIPTGAEWQHCRGSKPQYRGYTCGLWSSFHLLSVNAFLNDATNASFNPMHLPHAIEGFVKHFFGCTHCAQHFVFMVTEQFPIKDNVGNAADVMMYLWRAHNRVNSRLHDDVTEDPAFPKYQFPADFLCPQCRKGLPDGRPAWSGNDVLKFLINYYTQIRPHSQSSSGNFNGQDIFKLPATTRLL